MIEVEVAVIGAGAAGLAAARELRAAGCSDVIILEASTRIGGRVRSGCIVANGFESSVELGPEFVHGGDNNPLLDTLTEMGVAVRTLEWPNYYYFGKEGTLVDGPTADALPEMAAMHEAFESIGELDAAATAERSLLQFLTEHGVGSRVLDMANAVYANDYGADLSDIGLRETIAEQRAWSHGEDYIVLDGGATLSDAMRHLAEGSRVLTGFEATLVDWEARTASGGASPRVRVVDATGREVLARRLIVTAPLACLQRGAIAFRPELPAAKREALGRVRMGNALKVAVALARPVWPADFWDAVCADCTFPEVWLTPPADALRGADRPAGKPYVVVAFVAGERSVRLGELSEAELVRLLLAQLDAMFGTSAQPTPASACCVGQLVQNWHDEPFALGAYTHPTLGGLGARQTLAEPMGAHGGLVHFAGEATNIAVNPCVHGAMTTGVDAARAVLASLGCEASRAPAASVRGVLEACAANGALQRAAMCAGFVALAVATSRRATPCNML
jgi:monoamine oxidase